MFFSTETPTFGHTLRWHTGNMHCRSEENPIFGADEWPKPLELFEVFHSGVDWARVRRNMHHKYRNERQEFIKLHGNFD